MPLFHGTTIGNGVVLLTPPDQGDNQDVMASNGAGAITWQSMATLGSGVFDPAGSAQAVQDNLDTHEADISNPHSVTAAQVGAPTVADLNAVQANLDAHEADTDNPHSVTAVQVGADPTGSAAAVQANLDAHEADTNNPHSVTAVQAGADPAGSAQAVQDNLNTHTSDVSIHFTNPLTTKGDIWFYGGRLAVGTNNQVLVADSGVADGIKWTSLEGQNIGTGAGWYKQIVNDKWQFKSLVELHGIISITENTNDITIGINNNSMPYGKLKDVATGSVALRKSAGNGPLEPDLISNLTTVTTSGASDYLLLDVGGNLRAIRSTQLPYDPTGSAQAVQDNLNTHTANTSIHYADAPNDGNSYVRKGQAWEITTAQANTGVNLGTGENVYAGMSGSQLQFRSLTGNGSVILSESALTISVTATPASVGADPAGSSATVQSNLDTHTGNTSIHYADAPNDGNEYIRKNNTWAIASGLSTTLYISDANADLQANVGEGWNDFANRGGITRGSGEILYFEWPGLSGAIYQYAGNELGPTWTTTSNQWPQIGGGAVTWGSIGGNLSDQTDLQAALDAKANQTALDAHTGNSSIHFADAPSDGTTYGRKDGAWAVSETTNGANVGGFNEVYAGLDGSTLEFRTLQSTDSSVNITQGGDNLDFKASAASVGADPAGSAAAVQSNLDTHTANTSIHFADAPSDGEEYVRKDGAWTTASDTIVTGANIGGFNEVFAQKSGNELQFRTIQSSTNSVLITQNSQDLDIVATPASVGADPAGTAAVVQGNLDAHEADTDNPHSVTAAQAGADPAGSAAAVQANLDTHTGNTDIHFADAPLDLNEYVRKGQAWAIATAQANTGVSLGSGAEVYAGMSGSVLQFRDVRSSDNSVTITQETNDINFQATAASVGADPTGSAQAVQDNLNTHASDVSIHFEDAPNNANQYVRSGEAWVVIDAGDVVGPSVSVDNTLTKFDGTTGKLVAEATGLINAVDGALDFTPQTVPAHVAGRVYYDSTVQSLVSLTDNSRAVIVGNEVWVWTENNSGATILAGAPVALSSGLSGIVEAWPALADSFQNSQVDALMAESVITGSAGWAKIHGRITMDTSGFNLGDDLYLSDSVLGGLSSSVPSNYVVKVGTVLTSNVSGLVEISINDRSLGPLEAAFNTHLGVHNPHMKMNWEGTWLNGKEYLVDDVVRDGQWTMVCNTQTFDRPAPQPIGSPSWGLPEAPAWNEQNQTGASYSGVQIEVNPDVLGAIIAIRVWLPDKSPDTINRAYLLDVTDNDNHILLDDIIFGTTVPEDQWTEWNVEDALVVGGTKLRFILETRVAPGGPTPWGPYEWQYDGTGGGNPGENKFRRNGGHTELYISETDKEGDNRAAELDQINPGDTIRVEESNNSSRWDEYIVESQADNGAYRTFQVTRVNNGNTVRTNDCEISASLVPTASPSPYVELADYWLNNPGPNTTIKGFAVGTYDGDNLTLNDNAYGVDVQSYELSASPDWDVLATSSNAVAGGDGGSGSGETNDGQNVGGGAGVYRDKTGVILNLRSLQSSDSSLVVTQNADDIDLTASAASVGADPAGSAATVQGNLDTHEADTGNPHGVTAAQAGAADVTGFTSMERLTQAEYDALSPPDADTLYFIVG